MTKLKDWFTKEAQGEDFDKPHSPEYTLSRMALTMRQPQHQERFIDSCHWHTAVNLNNMLAKGEITEDQYDDVKIRLVGHSGVVSHSIVVIDTPDNPDHILIDSLEDFGGHYEDSGSYYAKFDPDAPENQRRDLVAELSVNEFIEQYYRNVQITPQKPGGGPSPEK